MAKVASCSREKSRPSRRVWSPDQSKGAESDAIGLETGATSPWLFHALTAAGLPVVCMDARHAHAALSMRPTKSDRNDARGRAEMLRMGWYRQVHAKRLLSHERRTMLVVRGQLVRMCTELDGQIRGTLKTFGLIVRAGRGDAVIRRAVGLAVGHPAMAGLIAKLAELQRHVVQQIAAIDRDLRRLVRSDPTIKRLTTVPGVGPVTAVAFACAIDEPNRFKNARDVGPYLGLTPTRYQSGETDRQGRISRCRDSFTRTLLYGAADQGAGAAVLALEGLGRESGEAKKAGVAVARRIAVILRCIWVDGTEFWWTREEAKAA